MTAPPPPAQPWTPTPEQIAKARALLRPHLPMLRAAQAAKAGRTA